MRRLIVLILVLIATPCFGATYYFDPGAAGGGNGSFAAPWNSLSQVAAKTFATGDDLYFRAGTSIIINSSNKRLVINWHGSESDQVIIGAYHIVGGQPVIGLGGYARPIFNGGGIYPDNENWAMIHHIGIGYVTVQDLHTKDSYGGGIWLMQLWNSENIWGFGNEIKNCHIINSGRQGILIARASNCLVEDNYINGTSLTATYIAGSSVPRYAGAAIEITGMDSEQTARNNVVRGNTIKRANESLGIYKGAYNTLIEDNIVYDMVGTGIYAANARNGIIRNNIVYNVPEENRELPLHPRSRTGRRSGIWIDAEGHVASIIKVTGEWVVYGNYLAGLQMGIWLQNNANDYIYQLNNKFYNNRIVDCDRNFWISQSVAGWDGNEIYDNYSYIFTADLVHVYSDMSPTGVTWATNTYNTDIATVTGSAATTATLAANASLGASALATTTGWRDLVPGAVDADDFLFSGETTTDPEPDPDPTLDSGNALTTGLTRAYIFDEGSGTSAFDHTANDAHMTLTSPAWSTLGLTMNSSGQVAAVPVPSFANAFSVFMAYTSESSTSQDYAKFFYYQNASVRDFQLERFTSDTEIRSDIGGTTDNTLAWTPVIDTFDQKFHTLLMTYDRTGGNRCLYINGSLQSCSGSTWTNPTFTGNMYLGGKDDGTRVIGATYHAFYTWSSVLTAADALSLHNDYDQIFLSPPSRTFEGVLPPFNFSGRIDGSRPKVTMDSTKPITIILGQ